MKQYKIVVEFTVKTDEGMAEVNRLADAIETAVSVQTADKKLFFALENTSVEDVYEDYDDED